MADWDDMVLVGRVARPHGLRGQVVVNPETDFVEERFRGRRDVLDAVGPRRRAADDRVGAGAERPAGGRRSTGSRAIEDVERLAGLELRVPEEALQPLGAGVYYQHQLWAAWWRRWPASGSATVVRVDGGAAGSLLVVDGPRGEVLIPLAADICVEIDVAAQADPDRSAGGTAGAERERA